MAAKAAQPKVKKIPMRQCLGCNEHKPKGELLRVVRSPEGEISLDFTEFLTNFQPTARAKKIGN